MTFVAAAVAAVAIIIYPPAELTDFGKRLASTALFVANIHFKWVTDYFAPGDEDLELLHVWSLAVEEQFYLFFPPLLWLAVRLFKPRHVPWFFAAAASLSFLLSVYRLTPSRPRRHLLPPLHPGLGASAGRADRISLAAPTLAAGGAVARHRRNRAAGRRHLRLQHPATPLPGAAAFVPCLGTALLLYSGRFHADTWVARMLSARPLVGFGLISYSLYLWHWPLLVMSTQFLMRPLTTVEAWAAILASVLLRRHILEARRSALPAAGRSDEIAGPATCRCRRRHRRPGAGRRGAASESRGLPWRVLPEVRRLEVTAGKSLQKS